MAENRGAGSKIGCVVFLVVLAIAGVKFYPDIKARFFGADAPLEWDQAAEVDGLRVRIRTAETEDSFGGPDGTSDINVTLDISNLTDKGFLFHAPKGTAVPKMVDDKGRGSAYADGFGHQIQDGEEISAHVHQTHDLLFTAARTDAQHFVLTLDLSIFSRSGTVRFRIPAEKVRDLR